ALWWMTIQRHGRAGLVGSHSRGTPAVEGAGAGAGATLGKTAGLGVDGGLTVGALKLGGGTMPMVADEPLPLPWHPMTEPIRPSVTTSVPRRLAGRSNGGRAWRKQ
ncbi:MAG: hypothetical protein ACREIT_09215, partial [Tepidisphaeraceae bacterium]